MTETVAHQNIFFGMLLKFVKNFLFSSTYKKIKNCKHLYIYLPEVRLTGNVRYKELKMDRVIEILTYSRARILGTPSDFSDCSPQTKI